MVPRETGNNAYAEFWRDKQRVLWLGLGLGLGFRVFESGLL